MIKYKIKRLIIITVQVLFLIGTVSNNIYAAGSAGNSGMYSIYNHMNNPFTNTISMVIGVIQAVGMATAVITLTIIGILIPKTIKTDCLEKKPKFLIENLIK